jgi:type IV pilus assembly protein PilB
MNDAAQPLITPAGVTPAPVPAPLVVSAVAPVEVAQVQFAAVQPQPVVVPVTPVVASPPPLPEPVPQPLPQPAPVVPPQVMISQPVVPVPAPEPISAPASATASTTSLTAASLLDILQRDGFLTAQQAQDAELERINAGKKIETVLVERKLVGEEALTKAKAELNGIAFVKISEVGTAPEAMTALPEGVARRYGMFPFAVNKQEGTLSVAMIDPLDLVAIDFAQQKTGLRLITHYAMPSELERIIAEKYAQSLSTEVTQALEETNQFEVAEEDLSQLSGEVVRQAPITKIVETVLGFALKARASDVHIEPQQTRTRIRYRIDGILQEKLILPKNVHDAVVSRIKILSKLKIDEKRIPQDGRFNFVMQGQEVDLRVSTLPTIFGEKIVMRLLKKNSQVPTLEDLGVRGLALQQIKESIHLPNGIILFTGPTGSGKTTSLYSILNLINTPKVNIMTLEDPVEYQMTGVNQVQVNPQAGLTFASGLRSFLRQDPNIIMVGEIRDNETVELAVQASLTGHLVFSTLHTSSAAGALPRMVDMGAEPFLLASSMTMSVAQRICRVINPEFKQEYKPEPAVIADIQNVLGPYFETWLKKNNKRPEDITLFRPDPNRPQTEPEYKGRVGIYEVMKITEPLRKMIMAQKPAGDLEQEAMKNGMLFMKQDGYLKVLEGLTTVEEVIRVAEV